VNLLYYNDESYIVQLIHVDCLVKLVRSTHHTANSHNSHSQIAARDEFTARRVDWQPLFPYIHTVASVV